MYKKEGKVMVDCVLRLPRPWSYAYTSAAHLFQYSPVSDYGAQNLTRIPPVVGYLNSEHTAFEGTMGPMTNLKRNQALMLALSSHTKVRLDKGWRDGESAYKSPISRLNTSLILLTPADDTSTKHANYLELLKLWSVADLPSDSIYKFGTGHGRYSTYQFQQQGHQVVYL